MSTINDKKNFKENGQNRGSFPVTECSQRYSIISFEMVGSMPRLFKEIIEWVKNYYLTSPSNGDDITGSKKILKKEQNSKVAMIENIFMRIKRPYILEMLNFLSMTRVHQSLNAQVYESCRLELNPERRVVLFEERRQQHSLSPKAPEQEGGALLARLKQERGAEIESIVHARKEDFEHLTDEDKHLLENMKLFMLSADDEDYEQLKAVLMNAPAAECARLGTWGAWDAFSPGVRAEQPKLKEKEKEEDSKEAQRDDVIKALYEGMGWRFLSSSKKRVLSRLKDYMIAATTEEFCEMKKFLETNPFGRCVEFARFIDRRETERLALKCQQGSSSSEQVVDAEMFFAQHLESIKRHQERLDESQSLLQAVSDPIVENPVNELARAIQYSLELEQTPPKPPVFKKKTRKIQSVEAKRRKEPKPAQENANIEKVQAEQGPQYKDMTTTLETFMRVYMGIDDKSIMLEPKNLQRAIDKVFGVQDRTRGSHKQYNQKDVRGEFRERLTYASHGAKDKVKPGTGQKILRTLITIPVLSAEEKEVRGWNQRMWGVELYDPKLEAAIHGAKGNVKGQRISQSEGSAAASKPKNNEQDLSSTPIQEAKRRKNRPQKR